MKNLWQALLIVRRCDRRAFRRRVLYVVIQSILPLVNLYLLKLLVDAVEVAVTGKAQLLSQGFSLSTLIIAVVAVFLCQRVVSALAGINNDVLSQRLVDYMSDLIQRQASVLDMSYYDNPDYHDTLHRAQQEAGQRPIQVLTAALAFMGSLLSLIGVAVLLMGSAPLVLPILVVAAAPSFLLRLYKARSIYSFRRNNTQLYRRTAYYGALLTSREAAKEMRAYHFAPRFRALFVQSRRHLVSALLRISRRIGLLDTMCSFIEAAALLGVLLLLIGKASSAAITVGTFVMLFEAFRRGQGYLSSLVGSVASLYESRLFVGNLLEFLSLRPVVVSPSDPVPFPERVESVEFRDISFRYPDQKRALLDGFSLLCEPGVVTRIGGQNGFGKSTLIKLLLRLYDPDSGAVLINGIDIRRFSLEDLRSHMGVLFQDFVRYQCTVAENINGDTGSSGKLLDFVARLPKGVDTLLGRAFDDGSELSMGQWQRIAIARALATEAPIIVLDEPTAWLDNQARQHLNDAIERVRPGKIIIMIQHE